MVWNKGAEAAGGDRTPLAFADLLDWRAQNRSASIGAFQNSSLNYTGGEVPASPCGGRPQTFLPYWARGSFGRDFQTSDEKVGSPHVALLSDRSGSHFNADKNIVGRSINLNDQITSIIGVMPPQLNFPRENVQLWRAIQWDQPTRRGPYFLTGVARLKPGVAIPQAAADSKTMTSSFDKGNFKFNFLSVNDFIVGDVKPALVALLIAVTLVLLIAAVNVANLTLVRAASRMKEISIRTALGAGRGRIIRRLLTESMLLAIAGGALGTVCAVWGVSLLVKFAPENLPRAHQIKIDGFVLFWTVLVSLFTGVVLAWRLPGKAPV